MTHQTLPLAATGAFSALFLDYISQKESLTPFYGLFPTLENFEKQLKIKQFDSQKREVLVKSLERQYAHLSEKPDLKILLDDKTFTVTTGHQLNIFTGPLYVIYKIITTINLAKKLKATYPDYNFVPVYWLASEDHDFEEISYFNLFGKKYTWKTDEKGAVGRMNPRSLGEDLKILPEKTPVFEKAYLQNGTLANAVRCYMNDLFGHEGLVCIDGDDVDLKQLFWPIIEDELNNQNSHRLVTETTESIAKLGYHTQISPREINLFYIDEQVRERVIPTASPLTPSGGITKTTLLINDIDLVLGNSQLLNSKIKNTVAPPLGRYAARAGGALAYFYSPNVVLRPLYQEMILPNLAYIGGPSEVPYWLQLKGLFDFYKMPMPILMPRNFALYVVENHQKRAEKLGLTIEDLFEEEAKIKKNYVAQNTTVTLDLNEEKTAIAEILNKILTKTIAIDKSLEGSVKAETTKLIHSLESLEKRIQKAEERNYDTELSQIIGLKSKLFPNGGLQERSDNFLNFYLNDNQFLQKLLDVFNPLDLKFNILMP